jgi:predicted RNase H-like nuclease (RuvC/YqgF family)
LLQWQLLRFLTIHSSISSHGQLEQFLKDLMLEASIYFHEQLSYVIRWEKKYLFVRKKPRSHNRSTAMIDHKWEDPDAPEGRIRRLEAEIKSIHAHLAHYRQLVNELRAEIERLRTKLNERT